MVLEFLPGGDLEKLIMRFGKLEERAVRYVVCTINITKLQALYSDPDEVVPILVPNQFCLLYLHDVRKLK